MNNKPAHSKFFLKGTFAIGIFSSALFALALAFFLNTVLKNTVSSDAGDDYGYLSSQDFSAQEISDFPESRDCQTKKIGQVVLVSDIETDNDLAKRVEVAVSSGGYFTKRGTLKKISSSYIDKLSLAYKTATGEGIEKTKLKTGLYFNDVPIDDELLVQLYSPSWGEESVSNKVKAIGKSCQTIFIYVPINMAKKKGDFDVCVHGREKSNDYSPKKTFMYPSEKLKIADFKKSNDDLIVSLGPCQDGAILMGRVNSRNQLSISDEAVSNDRESSANVNNPAGTKKFEEMNFSSNDTSYASSFLQEVNKERERHGLKKLVENKVLTDFALKRLKTVIAVDEGIVAGEKGFYKGGNKEGHPWMDRDFHNYIDGGGTINAMNEIRTDGFPRGIFAPSEVLGLYLSSKDGHREAVLSSTAKSMGNAVLEYEGKIWHLANFEEEVPDRLINIEKSLELK